jgi:predicted RecA/RadA family phage recombinase
MKIFVQPGFQIPLTAPVGGVVAGLGYQIGAVFVVAMHDAAAGAVFTAYIGGGVVTLVKATGAAWTEGALLYWDNTAKNVTTTVATNIKIGFATAARASGDVTGNVHLNASF